jgi:hypothetical protein
MKRLALVPSSDEAVADEDGVDRPRLARLLRREHVGQQHHALDVAAPPAFVGQEDRLTAIRGRRRIHLAREREDGGRGALRRKGVVAGRRASRHLGVDEGVLLVEAVLGEQALAHGLEEIGRRLDPDRVQALAHPHEVLRQAVGAPPVVAHDLVDRVREQEPAIERRDAGLVFREEAAVEIDDRHGAGCYQRRPAPKSRTALARSSLPARPR